jgi:hypothetical protein
VPAGTSDHGDPNLLYTPTKWFDVVVFYLANYLVHAATVKASPGESIIDLAFAVFLAIAFPFSGLVRGLEAIARHASFSWRRKTFSCGDLRTTTRAGALCFVVRNESWDGLGLPVQGDVVPNKLYDKDYQEDLTLSSSTSIPQSMVAIFQVVYASYTLYKTRGDQLNRYGYAAFGLTVTPYIIMSFLNLLGNLSTLDYPTLYLVGSAELEEAKLKANAAIDGVVRKVVRANWDEECKDPFTGLVRWSLSHGDEHSKTFFAECSLFKIVDREQPFRGPKLLRRSSFLWWGFMVLLGTIPYAVIGSLTQFQAAQSTHAQRALTMFWLASGVFIGAAIPFISFSFREMVDVTKGTFSRKAWENASDARISAKFAKENADIALGKAQDAMVIAEDARKNADIASQRLARLRQDSGKVEGASKEIDLRKTQSRVSDNLAVGGKE